MQRELLTTKDGSNTVMIPSLDVTYRSRHGAVQESMHVFIEAGLKFGFNRHEKDEELTVFEMGFGTGLNALLTCIECLHAKRRVNYIAIEAYPLEKEIVDALGYDELPIPNDIRNDAGNYVQSNLRNDIRRYFMLMHNAASGSTGDVHPYFQFTRYNSTL